MTATAEHALKTILEDPDWQMPYGERLVLEGIVSSLQPQLALEIGSAEGGSLDRTALHSQEVHSFDLVEVRETSSRHANVTYHTGDSHQLLPEWLAEIRAEGRNIDYALVDGDHSADGAFRDVEDILRSGVLRGVLLVHDSNNPEVRRGLERIRFEDYPQIRYVDLAFVAGNMTRIDNGFRYQMWGGFALILVDPGIQVPPVVLADGIRQNKFYDLHMLTRAISIAPQAARRARTTIGLRTRLRRLVHH